MVSGWCSCSSLAETIRRNGMFLLEEPESIQRSGCSRLGVIVCSSFTHSTNMKTLLTRLWSGWIIFRNHKKFINSLIFQQKKKQQRHWLRNLGEANRIHGWTSALSAKIKRPHNTHQRLVGSKDWYPNPPRSFQWSKSNHLFWNSRRNWKREKYNARGITSGTHTLIPPIRWSFHLSSDRRKCCEPKKKKKEEKRTVQHAWNDAVENLN